MPWDRRTASSAITSTWAWRKFRLDILDRDGWRCQERGPNCIGRADQVDHPENVAAGGAHLDPDNARAICGPCHEPKTQVEASRGRTAWQRPAERHPGLRA
ncbi:hypothetical protein ABW16_21500 [Mycolicibacter heraklionensis]|uniref:HNH endonuclease n=1 Tax=Mycolicibacter heraklionensis TaxID=512402 RepID=A0ABR5FA57_9MYCO|nr:hypothetical protein ABW16_21500 [Mycolicibacter heraklionensis]